jgi:hypothetical protein
MTLNWLPILASALIPLLVGFLYYNDNVLGKAWKRYAGIDEDRLKQGNFVLILLFTLLLGVLLAGFLLPVVFHFMHVFSATAPEGGGMSDPTSEAAKDAMAFYEKYGTRFRTFRHGALHGAITAFTGIWPVLAINALFERRGWRYTAIHLGYWVITLTLMGGIICAFG